jgi:hypothetical protein
MTALFRELRRNPLLWLVAPVPVVSAPRLRRLRAVNRPGFFGGLNLREDGADVERNPILPGIA